MSFSNEKSLVEQDTNKSKIQEKSSILAWFWKRQKVSLLQTHKHFKHTLWLLSHRILQTVINANSTCVYCSTL